MSEHESRQLILASGSPRRKQLLEGLDLKFSVEPSDISETFDCQLSVEDVVRSLAFSKANDIAGRHESGVVIGADTIVVKNNAILGKPKNKEDAFTMLKQLQGRVHTVYSGLAIIDIDRQEHYVDYEATHVFIRPLSDEDIEAYIATEEPMDKAGSYAIQGLGALFVEKIEGDYFSVVGLPLRKTADYLKKCGIYVLPFPSS